MDTIDFKIVKILQDKARIPNVEVARQIGMAPSAVLERIKKLETLGIIQGYEVRLNPEHFDSSLIAFVTIKIKDTLSIKKAGRELARIDAVQEVHFLAGNDSMLVKLRAADTRELENLLMTKIAAVKEIISTKTQIVLSTFKESARICLGQTGEKNKEN